MAFKFIDLESEKNVKCYKAQMDRMKEISKLDEIIGHLCVVKTF